MNFTSVIQLMAFGLFFGLSQITQAQVIFGAEWTFTNQNLIDAGRKKGDTNIPTRENEIARDQLAFKIAQSCTACRVEMRGNPNGPDVRTYRINYPDGTWVDIGVDPWVIELNATPMTAEEYLNQSKKFQQIFSFANELGYKAHFRIGGGHIHIDVLSAFGGSELAARNFIVDLMNRPELAMGALNKDYLNAPPLAILKGNQRKNFIKKLHMYDDGKLTFKNFIMAINNRVYTSTFYSGFNSTGTKKFQAINLTRTTKNPGESTIELRFLRPQKSFEDFILLLRLFEARIEKIKQIDHPIIYNPKSYPDGKIAPKLIADSFNKFVSDAGLEPKDYSKLLPRSLRQHGNSILKCSSLFQ